MIGRRKVLQMLGVSSVAAPLTARMEAQKLTAQLANVQGIGGLQGHGPIDNPSPPTSGLSYENRKIALLNFPTIRAELESLLYEAHSHIYRIDADIAVKKSFSLNAKITFQRQRNVAKAMEDQVNGWRWNRLENFWSTIAKRYIGRWQS